MKGRFSGLRGGLCRLAIIAVTVGTPAAAAWGTDPALVEAGKKQFRRCSACHAMDAEARPMFGPHLAGIVGRRAGGLEGYEYTEVLRDQTFVWDEAKLDEWLERPNEVVPGMCHSFSGLRKPEDRTALIAFLKDPGS
jgi:cytochrome c